MTRLVMLVAVVSLVAGGLTPATGQTRLEVTPVIGLYAPLTNVIELSDGTTAKQSTAPAVGARVSVAPGNSLSFEAAVTYTPSDVAATAGAAGGPSSLFFVTARGVWLLGQPESRVRPYLAGGGALIVRNGEFYQSFSGTSDVGANVAAGLRLALGKVQGRLEVESYLYAVELTGLTSDQSTGSQFQSDLVVSLAIAIPLGG
jgi:hypothetical protein